MKHLFASLVVVFIFTFNDSAKAGQITVLSDSIKTITVKVKGINCSMDLKMIAANVEKIEGVTSCKPGKAGTTTAFVVQYNPLLVKEKEIFGAIEKTGSCENPDERPYKVKQ